MLDNKMYDCFSKAKKSFLWTVILGTCVLLMLYFVLNFTSISQGKYLDKQQDSVHALFKNLTTESFHHLKDIRKIKDLLTEVNFEHIKVNNPNDCAERKLLVYTCNAFCGGWGDRQKGIITSFLLALLSNRTFVIDMNYPCELENIIESNLYDWVMCKPFLAKVSKNETETLNKIGSSSLRSDILSPEFATNGARQVIRLKTNVLILDTIREHKNVSKLMTWILKMPNHIVMRSILNILFENNESQNNQLNEFMKNTVRGRTLVCAHVRKGKNPTMSKDVAFTHFRGVPNETTIFSFLQKYSDDRKYLVYVASDSENIKRDAAKISPNFASVNKTIIHVDRFDKSSNSLAAICDGFSTVLYEQVLLSRCGILVLTNSNLGRNAAYMRGTSNGLFLYVTKQDRIVETVLSDL